MTERKPLSISLTPELHTFVCDLVKSGDFSTSSEIVRAGLRLLQRQQQRDVEAPTTSTASVNPERWSGTIQQSCLIGGGEAGERLRAVDWVSNPLGSPERWPLSLQATIRILLNSDFPMMVHWGPELITFYNDAYSPSLGHKHPGNLGHPAREWWPEMWDQLTPIFDQVLAGRAYYVEDACYRPDRDFLQQEDAYFTHCHSPLWDDHGNVAGIFLVVTETTRRVVAERELLQSNTRLEQQVAARTAELRLYRDIVQSSAAPICAFDTEFRLIAFNQAHSDEFYRIFARRVQLGEVFPDLFPPDQAPIMRGLMARALQGEIYTVAEEFGDPNLAKPYWEVSYSPLRDKDGQIIGAFHHAKDISARLRAEAELTTAQEALRQSQKMEAVGQLTGGVAHDFNNLLTIIRSSVDFLRRPDLPDPRKSRYLDAVSDTVDRAAKLTGQLLAFARRQTLKPEVIDVGEKLCGVAEMLDTVTGARIRVLTRMPDAPCYVKADISQFETALINMAVNARDAMNGEGTLTLKLICGVALPPIRGHAGAKGPFVAVSLTDTGDGIPADKLARIFEPFFTTKEVGKGTGLGLSQVFGFTKQSGGDVDVVSTQGSGTTITMYLPEIETGSRPEGPKDRDDALSPLGSGQCVLVVEDNIEVGRFATQILEDLGYRTTWVVNAEEALDKLGLDGGGFDAVFSDVVMPGMGGLELVRVLQQRLPDLPVVLASGYSHVLAQEGAHRFELLHKPYGAEQLGQILGRVTRSRCKSGAAKVS